MVGTTGCGPVERGSIPRPRTKLKNTPEEVLMDTRVVVDHE